MSKTPTYDPMTSDARSSWLAGLTEACNKISGVLNMKTSTFEDLPMPELFISSEDRFRIYQAPLGNKLWLSTPAPIIKKNGVVITPQNDHFSIDYLGGSIAFEDDYILSENDSITASATYIVGASEQVDILIEQVNAISREAGRNKGAFDSLAYLQAAYPIASAGDFAIVTDEDTIYIWDTDASKWVDVHKNVDLSAYYTSAEIDNMLGEKENVIVPHGEAEESDEYYYSGRKTWLNLFYKIRNFALTGLITDDNSVIEASDTLLVALGKLQAQISGFNPYISGTSRPTTSTVGQIGQDYVNTSNGDKYHLIAIENGRYVWEKYGNVSMDMLSTFVNVEKGGIMEMSPALGTGPYSIEFTDETDDLSAKYISYSSELSGLNADNVQTAIDVTNERISNKNLLDNPDFEVNQQGVTSWSNGYGVDRWVCVGTAAIGEAGIRLSMSTNGPSILYQIMDGINLSDGKTRSISYLDSDGSVYGGILTAGYTRYGNFEFCYNTGTALYIRATNNTSEIKTVKLELGPVQTLAHKEGDTWVLNDPPPNKTVELLKCQRYWIKAEGHYAGMIFANRLYTFVPTPVTMRTAPSVTLKMAGTIHPQNGSSQIPTTIGVNRATPNGIRIWADMPNNAPGLGAWLDSELIFDANL